ncbi:MAG: hypothetical protein ACKOBY_03430 [Cyanobium sp.]
MPDSIPIPGACDCLGRTCLKWGADGEITALDFSLVMQRLALVDPEVSALLQPTAASPLKREFCA